MYLDLLLNDMQVYNDDRTEEVLQVGSRRQASKMHLSSVTIREAAIVPAGCVTRNSGVIFNISICQWRSAYMYCSSLQVCQIPPSQHWENTSSLDAGCL